MKQAQGQFVALKQESISHALAINQDNKLLLVSDEFNFKLFYFKDGGLKFLQNIRCPILKQEYTNTFNYINTLNFYKKKQIFISGSDTLINKWSYNLISNPKYIQRLEGQEYISSLVIHPLKENIIISGSKLGSIVFWFDQPNYKRKPFLQVISEHIKCVVGLSINNDGSKVISAGKDGIILVMEPISSSEFIWIVKQKIQVQKHGYRICFINNDSFTFQPYGESQIHYYILVNESFIKDKEFQIQLNLEDCMYYFPQIYNTQKKILFSKCGNTLNILKHFEFQTEEQYKKSEQQFQLTQVIVFNEAYNPWIFGTVSEDGEYLIIFGWCIKEHSSKKIYNKELNVIFKDEKLIFSNFLHLGQSLYCNKTIFIQTNQLNNKKMQAITFK
ncbi:unnamed protein product (macronuclear) [Paramecium tetraurelia]|uniref:WD40-repeat-containing domain n=1 Tax=Paramecium tetraurelia TaxID=5888 RepID=A0BYC1_PARTE|nr:uncharacterized protein GSPATT00033391001 [Paramecium tetraurelia]CAK63538.1 unnamed protein product [Paramecium tetraurelia]|eukprot:XP_001430936.1 hypothetical protein (macronuclear) [Paramecium tetraurelia strain d4-2]